MTCWQKFAPPSNGPGSRASSTTGRSNAGEAAVVIVGKLLHEDAIDLEVHFTQQPRLLRVWEEGTLETIDDDAFDLVGTEAEGARRQGDLVRDRGGGDQAAVGVERHAQALLEIEMKRMLANAR